MSDLKASARFSSELSRVTLQSLLVLSGVVAAFFVPVWRELLARVARSGPACLASLGLLMMLWAAAADRWPGLLPTISRRQRVRWQRLQVLGLPAVVLLSIAPLFAAWTGARSDGYAIAGILPYSDAGNYYEGALGLLRTGNVDEWNSRRPLNAVLLAVRLALTGENLQGALVIQSLLLGVAVWCAGRVVAADFGTGARWFMIGALLLVGSTWVAATTSETLGLTLGTLGFALSWSAARTRSAIGIGVAMGVLALGLSSRPGPLFMLPALVVWAYWAPLREPRFDRRGALSSLFGIGAAFALSGAIAELAGAARAGAQSNFAYTLYGLSVGGKGWRQGFIDHPELKSASDTARGQFLYARAFENMASEPWQFLVGLWRNTEAFVLPERMLGASEASRWLAMAGAFVALGGLLAWLTRRRGSDDCHWLLVAALVGAFLSVPFIYLDGGVRVFVVALPFAIALAPFAIGATRRSLPIDPEGVVEPRRMAWAPGALAAGVALAALLGAALPADAPSDARPSASATCLPSETTFVLSVTRTTPRIALEVTPSSRSFPPRVDLDTFRRGVGAEISSNEPFAEALLSLPTGAVLLAARDPASGRLRFIATRAPIVARAEKEAVSLCVVSTGQEPWPFSIDVGSFGRRGS